MRFNKGSSFYLQQTDIVLNQANPVSGTYYTVLDTTTNVKIECLMAAITWGVTQPTNLRVRVTVDGQIIIYTVANPVSGSAYQSQVLNYTDQLGQLLTAEANRSDSARLEADDINSGKSVKVEVAITWAVTQPTPMICILKWARLI